MVEINQSPFLSKKFLSKSRYRSTPEHEVKEVYVNVLWEKKEYLNMYNLKCKVCIEVQWFIDISSWISDSDSPEL